MILNVLIGSVLFASSAADIKQAINFQSELIQRSPEQKSDCLRELAFLYLKDQDQEHAFESFLQLLDILQPEEVPPPYDPQLYKEAFAIYIDSRAETPQATAAILLEKLLPILKEKPDQFLLDYFVAIAYANLSKYDEFFKHFERAFHYYPCHYLAYKIKAILHIKLLERTRGERERIAQRQKIVENLMLAVDKEPHDTTIYKLLISFSPQEKKNGQVRLCLNKIINDNIMIPRNELMFYMIEAVETNQRDLAERFIIQAHEWYPQSRIIKSAQKYLDAHK